MGEPERDDLDSTVELLARIRGGDAGAQERLLTRYLPRLRRWARGRLPSWARDLLQTEDLVQEVVLRTLHELGSFQPRFDGALGAYLRQGVHNRIQDEVRRIHRRPRVEEMQDTHVDPSPTPLEEAVGSETLARYESALERLRPEDREAVVARVELDLDWSEMAKVLGKPSPDAARVAVSRAILRLAKEMERDS
jgi:RNA polymerase sigma factor (sigma-70 family)